MYEGDFPKDARFRDQFKSPKPGDEETGCRIVRADDEMVTIEWDKPSPFAPKVQSIPIATARAMLVPV